MQSRIEEEHKKLMDGVTLQFQKEKEDKNLEGHWKLFEEFEFYLEDVHAKYEGIISKVREIKDQAHMVEDAIIFEKKINYMDVQK